MLRGRKDDAFFIPSGDALDGEAHERKAVSQSLRLVDLEVDEEREQRRIDEPPAADRKRTESTPFAHDRIQHVRGGT